MSNTENVRGILIRRYSKLSNTSVEKTRSKFDRTTIDDIIEKHEKKLIVSVVLVVLVIVTLIALFVSLYLSRDVPYGMIPSILLLIVFQKGLHDNYEMKEILKMLKEIGVP